MPIIDKTWCKISNTCSVAESLQTEGPQATNSQVAQ
jgi:hypothetical protein